MAHRITLIPGDGIGPEITEAATRVLEKTGVGFEWEAHEAGIRAYEKTGTPLPPVLLESIRKNKVGFKGPLTTLVGEGFQSANVTLRKELDLYTNLRPVRSIEGVKSRYEDINLVIVRENTEDLYSGIEHMIMPGVTGHPVRSQDRRQPGDAARFEPEPVRRAAALQPLRGHRLGSLRRSRGRSRSRARRQHRRRVRGVRGGPRLRSRHRRQGHRQSYRSPFFGSLDAAPSGRERGRGPRPQGGIRGVETGRGADPRPRRQGED